MQSPIRLNKFQSLNLFVISHIQSHRITKCTLNGYIFCCYFSHKKSFTFIEDTVKLFYSFHYQRMSSDCTKLARYLVVFGSLYFMSVVLPSFSHLQQTFSRLQCDKLPIRFQKQTRIKVENFFIHFTSLVF